MEMTTKQLLAFSTAYTSASYFENIYKGVLLKNSTNEDTIKEYGRDVIYNNSMSVEFVNYNNDLIKVLKITQEISNLGVSFSNLMCDKIKDKDIDVKTKTEQLFFDFFFHLRNEMTEDTKKNMIKMLEVK